MTVSLPIGPPSDTGSRVDPAVLAEAAALSRKPVRGRRTENEDERFAHGLKKIRQARAMTQAELGRKAHVDSLTVSRLENLHHPPTLSTAARLAEALEIDPMEIFNPKPVIPPRARKKKEEE